jgi:hypothetical protein
MQKPVLVDDFLIMRQTSIAPSERIDSTWYVKNPFERLPWYTRLFHAFLVLIGKATAFQFKEDTL